MTAILDKTVETLRDELQHYGEMLALLDVPGEGPIEHRDKARRVLLDDLRAQCIALQNVRTLRETYQRRLAWALGCPDRLSFRDLIPLLPEVYRPLLHALVEENRQLLRRIRAHGRRHRWLLRHSFHRSQQPLALLGEESDRFAAERDEGFDHDAAG